MRRWRANKVLWYGLGFCACGGWLWAFGASLGNPAGAQGTDLCRDLARQFAAAPAGLDPHGLVTLSQCATMELETRASSPEASPAPDGEVRGAAPLATQLADGRATPGVPENAKQPTRRDPKR